MRNVRFKTVVACAMTALVTSCSDDAGQGGDGTRAPTGSEQPAFELVASTKAIEVPRGGQTVLVLSTTPTTDAVLFPTATGAAPGVEVDVAPVAKSSAALVTIRATASAVPGPSSLVFTARAGAATAATTVALTITEAETAFALTVAPSAVSVRRGSSVAVGVDLARAPGFAEPVEIALVDPTKQLDAQAFTISGGGSFGALQITPRPDTTIGKHPLVVRARSASAERTAALDVEVTRPSGSLDPSYGPGGVRRFGGYLHVPDDNDAFFLEDGSILFSGSFIPNTEDLCSVSRFTPDLVVDLGFGTGGTGTASFSDPRSYAQRDITLLPDGRIGLVGTFAPDGVFATAVFDKYGKLFAGFDGDGQKIFAFPPPGSDHPGAIAASPTGLLVASSPSLRVASVLLSGGLDTTFGAGQGWVEHAIPFYPVRLMARDAVTGKITLAGQTSQMELIVARLLPNGALDPSYGTGGYVIVTPGTQRDPLRMAFVGGGALVVSTRDYGSSSVVRLTDAGTLDPAWPKNPVVVDAKELYRGVLAVHPDGKILVGDVEWSGASSPVILRRLNPDGSFDLAFDAGSPGFIVGTGGRLLATRIVDDDRFEVFGTGPGGAFVARYFR